MAQFDDDDLRRTDASEVRFQETVPDNQKYNPAQEPSISALPKGGQDTDFHVDKPTSVSETGYGGVSGRGNDISSIVQKPGGLHHEERQSSIGKVKDFAVGVEDLASGKKQAEASVPVVDQSAAHCSQNRKEGLGDKVKEFATGQKPGHGTNAPEMSEEPPLSKNGNLNSPSYPDPAAIPSATRTDSDGRPIEGPRDDNTKKEGIMSKVMDKFNLGTNKDSAH